MPLNRAYITPAAPSTIQPIRQRRPEAAPAVFGHRPHSSIRAFCAARFAARPRIRPTISPSWWPTGRRETEAERNEYMYRQTVTLEELDDHGGARGNYREVRDIIFSPKHERTEEMVGKPQNSLKNLILTDEDFRDIRDIQPLVLTEDRLWNYETKFRGDETMDDVDCWVLAGAPAPDPLRPAILRRHALGGQEGIQHRAHGGPGRPADPDHQDARTCFPRFTTMRKPIDGKHWFPIYTYADDTLHFKTGPQRERLRIAYSNYKRFGAESTFTPKYEEIRQGHPHRRRRDGLTACQPPRGSLRSHLLRFPGLRGRRPRRRILLARLVGPDGLSLPLSLLLRFLPEPHLSAEACVAGALGLLRSSGRQRPVRSDARRFRIYAAPATRRGDKHATESPLRHGRTGRRRSKRSG